MEGITKLEACTGSENVRPITPVAMLMLDPDKTGGVVSAVKLALALALVLAMAVTALRLTSVTVEDASETNVPWLVMAIAGTSFNLFKSVVDNLTVMVVAPKVAVVTVLSASV